MEKSLTLLIGQKVKKGDGIVKLLMEHWRKFRSAVNESEKKKKESKKTNEAKGSGHGDGISPRTAAELVRAAAKQHRPGRAKILDGELQSLIQWGRENLPGMTTSAAKDAIDKKINKKD